MLDSLEKTASKLSVMRVAEDSLMKKVCRSNDFLVSNVCACVSEFFFSKGFKIFYAYAFV